MLDKLFKERKPLQKATEQLAVTKPVADAPKVAPPPELAQPPLAQPGTDKPGTDKPGTDKPGPTEIGGPQGPEPTRFGDWEKNGRCYDF